MTTTRDSHLILRSCTKTEVCAFDCADRNDTETDILFAQIRNTVI